MGWFYLILVGIIFYVNLGVFVKDGDILVILVYGIIKIMDIV